MKKKLNTLKIKFDTELKTVRTEAELANLKANFLGKKGELGSILANLSQAPPEERKFLGQAANELKTWIIEEIETARIVLERKKIDAELAADWTDITIRRSLKAESVKGGPDCTR